MQYALITIVIVLIAYLLKEFISKNGQSNAGENIAEKLPYNVTDRFLTNTERSFYHSLKLCVGERAVICPKVGLKDIFYINKNSGKNYMKHFNRIAKKHVDFLLCDPKTMNPICAFELDDVSHTSKKSYERDLFVERI